MFLSYAIPWTRRILRVTYTAHAVSVNQIKLQSYLHKLFPAEVVNLLSVVGRGREGVYPNNIFQQSNET